MLNPEIDFSKVAQEYNSEGLSVIDNFLDLKTVKSIRDYALYSGIKEDLRTGYYTINFKPQGNWTPELDSIVRDLKVKIPSVCGQFLRGWSFVYDEECDGVSIHADPVNTNLNFWVTPEDCISDFRKNGLIIWKSTPKKGWSYNDYNTSNDEQRKKIYEYLAESGAEKVNIKYKFNRAILFNSQMFHKTNGVKTKPGKENSRVNYTFLFGEDMSEDRNKPIM